MKIVIDESYLILPEEKEGNSVEKEIAGLLDLLSMIEGKLQGGEEECDVQEDSEEAQGNGREAETGDVGTRQGLTQFLAARLKNRF